MDFRYTPEEQRFRMEVRQFIKDHLLEELANAPTEGRREHVHLEMEFIRKLAKKGWLGAAFPKEYGGRGENHVPMTEYILIDELQGSSASVALTLTYLVTVIGNTLLTCGADELKKEFLPRILNAEVRFCIAYSEPDAGNDIANIKTRAVLDGNDYVLNGSKRFITKADTSDYMWALVRTEPGIGKHKGLSIIIVPTRTPGITINPIRMRHSLTTCEVFLDDVRVPRRYLVGEPGRGWRYLMEALTRERATMINWRHVSEPWERFVHWVRSAEIDGERLIDDPVVRQSIANMHLNVAAGKMAQLIVGSRSMNKEYICTVEAAVNKMWRAFLSWPKADLIIDTMQSYGVLSVRTPGAPMRGWWPETYAAAGHELSAAGGLDLNRQIIAQLGLGLPKLS